jgi:hypothetical protein
MIGGFIGKPIGGVVGTLADNEAIGLASGAGETSAEGRSVVVAVGAASGVGAASAQALSFANVIGSAPGLGAASAEGRGFFLAYGLASGVGNADGKGTVFSLIILRPGGDIALDGWTDQADGTANIYQAIDEASASDDDFVQSPFFYNDIADLKVRLFDGATQIAEWTHTSIAVAFADVEQVLTTPQYEAITDFGNLFVEFDDNRGSVYRFSLGDPGDLEQPIKLKYRCRKLVA